MAPGNLSACPMKHNLKAASFFVGTSAGQLSVSLRDAPFDHSTASDTAEVCVRGPDAY